MIETQDADWKMEMAISRMLRAGVSLAAAAVLLGSFLYFLGTHGTAPDYRHFHGSGSPALQLAPVVQGIRHFDGRSLIRAGVLLLCATPILRVVFCFVGFARQKDRLYTAISAIVLCVLLFSLFRH